MFDRQTQSLWNNLTGEPVVGKLANSGLQLKILPNTFTTWKEWKTANPATTVLKPDPELAKRWGFRYESGAADRARAGVEFPIWLKKNVLSRNEDVYAIRIGLLAKAYPVSVVVKERIIHDRLGDQDLVVIGNPDSGAVKIYMRKSDQKFKPGTNSLEVTDSSGNVWRVADDALISKSERLERIPGHLSWWFAWYGFFPQTEVYTPHRQPDFNRKVQRPQRF